MIKAIGVYQLIGGLMGIIYLLMVEAIPLSYGLILATIIFLLSIIAGVLLLTENRYGIIITLLNQALQVLSFSLLGIEIINYNPASLELGYNVDSALVFDFHIGSKFLLNFTNSNEFKFCTVNLSALMIFIVLWKQYQKIDDEKPPLAE